MQARVEIDKNYTKTYVKASKKDRGRMPGRGARGDRQVLRGSAESVAESWVVRSFRRACRDAARPAGDDGVKRAIA